MQDGKLVLGFDPDSNHFTVKAFAQPDGRLQDAVFGLFIKGDIEQCLGQFDPLHREPFQISERGIGRGKMIQRQTNARLRKAIELTKCPFRVAHRNFFGYFYFDHCGIDFVRLGEFDNAFEQVCLNELAA